MQTLNRPIFQAAILPALLLLMSANADAAELQVRVTGLTSSAGAVTVSVYSSPAEFPAGRALVELVATRQDDAAVVTFSNLPPGNYAVAAYQDENGNGKLDKNMLGKPKERTGFSRGAVGTMGPPAFKNAQFAVVDGPPQDVPILLKP